MWSQWPHNNDDPDDFPSYFTFQSSGQQLKIIKVMIRKQQPTVHHTVAMSTVAKLAITQLWITNALYCIMYMLITSVAMDGWTFHWVPVELYRLDKVYNMFKGVVVLGLYSYRSKMAIFSTLWQSNIDFFTRPNNSQYYKHVTKQVCTQARSF